MKKLLIILFSLVGMTHALNSTASYSKSLSAVDSAITMSAGAYNSISFQLAGTWNATVKFEGTVNTTTWTTVYAVNQNGGTVDSVATANGVYLLSGNGFKFIRARCTARSSGTIVIQAMGNEGTGVVSLLNQSSAGASSNVSVTSSVLPTLASTSTKQSDGSQKTQVVDGSGNVIGATSNALDVNIKSGASSGAVAQGSTTSGQTGGLNQAAVTTAAPSYTTGQTSPLSLTTGGALRVDASAASLTVGTHAVTQSGTWTVQPGNTANTTAWKVDGSAVTQPVSYATTGSGTATGALRVELPTNGTGVLASVGAISTSVTPGTGASNLGKAEDAAHTSADVGVMSLAVRRDANTTLATSDGEYGPIQLDANGNVKVAIITGAGSGGTSATDDAALTPASSSGTPIMGFADETSPDVVDEGDGGIVRMTTYRALHVNLRDASGNELGAGAQYAEDTVHTSGDRVTMMGAVRRDANTSLVGSDGDVAIPQVDANGNLKVAIISGAGSGGTAAADAATFTASSSNMTPAGAFYQTTATSNPLTNGQQGTLQATANRALFTNLRNASGTEIGTSGAALRTDPTGTTTQPVSYATTGSGTATGALRVELPTNGTGVIATVGAVTTITNAVNVGGAAAHDAAISGNPLRSGGRAQSADITAVTTGDVSDQLLTLLGKQVVQPYALPALNWRYVAAAGGLVNTTGVTAKAAGAAGIRNYVTSVQCMNSHQTISTEIEIRDGAAGTVMWRGWAQAAGGGFAHTFPNALRGSAATLVEIAEVSTTATAGVVCNLQGYEAGE